MNILGCTKIWADNSINVNGHAADCDQLHLPANPPLIEVVTLWDFLKEVPTEAVIGLLKVQFQEYSLLVSCFNLLDHFMQDEDPIQEVQPSVKVAWFG